jgi:peptide/nickel transport system ATP-binding protein
MHAIVGESGCGKSVFATSILKLLPKNAIIKGGEILFEGQNLLTLNENEIRKIRGKKIAFIPQDPMTSLNPLYTIEDQLLEVIDLPKNEKEEAREKILEKLNEVGIVEPEKRLSAYPHELSGGMKQRIIIAMALLVDAEIILADEPTTALDVTIASQILDLLSEIKNRGKSVILITHDLGIVSKYCDEVSVMYLGKIVEQATPQELFKNPKHPYTIGLFNSLPDIKAEVDNLKPIKGLMPDPTDLPKGCPFHPRCDMAKPECSEKTPENIPINANHSVRCLLFNKR